MERVRRWSEETKWSSQSLIGRLVNRESGVKKRGVYSPLWLCNYDVDRAKFALTYVR